MKRGTIRHLRSDHNHYYVKIDDDEFGWWRLEDESKLKENRMLVRMTTNQVLFETHFQVILN